MDISTKRAMVLFGALLLLILALAAYGYFSGAWASSSIALMAVLGSTSAPVA